MGGVVVIGALAAALAGCAEESHSDSPWAAEFEHARQEAVTDFLHDVLSDDVITDEEFREVRQHYIDCLGDAGIKAEALDNGNYNVYTNMSAKQEEAERTCSAETIAVIEPLYYAIRYNPQNQDFTKLMLECLRKGGFVDDTFTGADWQELIYEFAAVMGDGSEANPGTAGPVPLLPGGTPINDPRVQECSTNPLGL